MTRAFPFILCPRGTPVPGRAQPAVYGFSSAADVEKELRVALAALKRRFGRYVASSPVVLAGFSLGATYAVELLRQEPSFFSRAVLVEGGILRWTPTQATLFGRRGGERVLFVCAQPACRAAGERAVTWTRTVGAEGRLLYPGPLGHVLDARMARAIRGVFDWVVEGDARWAQAWQAEKKQ